MTMTFQRFALLLLLSSWMAFNAIAQTPKQLTLEEAVMGQWRQFYPASMDNLRWRPDMETYTYVSQDGRSLYQAMVGKGEPQTLLTVKQLGKALNQPLNALPRLQWLDKNTLVVHTRGQQTVVTLSEKDSKLEKKYTVVAPEEGENVDVHLISQQVAYTREHNVYLQTKDGKEIAITNNTDPNIVSGQAIARYEFGISKGTFWSPKGRYLAFYQKDETDVADYPLLDITATPGALRTIKYPMAGQKSERAKVGIYDTKSGQTRYLMVSGEEDQYLTNLGWGPKGEFVYIAVVNRDQNHMWLNQYEAKTGKYIKTLFEEKHPKYVEPEHGVWFIPGQEKEFLWWSERDGFMHLHRYNIEGEYLGQVTQGEWVTLSILGMDKNKKTIFVQGTDESGLNTTVYSASLVGKKPSKRLITQKGVHNFRLNSTGSYLIDEYSTIQDPYIAQIVSIKGEVKKELKRTLNPYKGYAVGQPEFISLKAADGTPLNARMIKPVDFDPNKKYPVIVYVYGGPHAQMIQNRWLGGASLWMYYAASKGYLVFTLDNRGSSNRGFKFESVIHRQLGKVEMEDQLVGVEYLKSLPYVNADKMAVHGWSFGGYMTTSFMLKHPDVFKVGVAGGPVTDWNYYEVMYGERYMDRPTQNPEGYRETQLKNFAGNLKGDLLLIHGTVDDVVVMQHNLSLVQAFIKKGILMDFFPYPMHPHNVRGKDRVHLMNKVLTYIDEKLNSPTNKE